MKHHGYVVAAILAAFVATLSVAGFWIYYSWRDHREDAVIVAASRRYGVESALVKAVMWRESWFNPRARGGHGELGLMQITETAANEWAESAGVKNFQPEHLLDPATNAFAGTFYLGKLLKRYPNTDNPTAYALADYNAGRTRVLGWNKGAAATNSAAFLAQMDFPGTKKYILAILRRRLHYRADFPAEGALRTQGVSKKP